MRILFLSANDFKEKSIQVLRKTPEAYAAEGFQVTYLVARDRSRYGNYFYEKEFDPAGVKVVRFTMPLTGLRNRAGSTIFQTIFTQLAGYLTIWKLYRKARRIIRNENPDIIYGYETHGVCALRLLRFFGKTGGRKCVTRFQGTWLAAYIRQNRRLKMLLNYDDVLALKTRADLCIMTNDGTEGLYAMQKLKSKALHNTRFWVNGVDAINLQEADWKPLAEKLNPGHQKFVLCSVSRLENWKRVDRIVNVVSHLVHVLHQHNFLYIAIGDGNCRTQLEELVRQQNLGDYIVFTGSIPNSDVQKYLMVADAFASTYDLSNVGNPLLEAIRAEKIIFTLNNGTTGEWIQHGKNGFIYPPDNHVAENMALDLQRIITDSHLRKHIQNGIKETATAKLWTWKERMDAEVQEVKNLFRT